MIEPAPGAGRLGAAGPPRGGRAGSSGAARAGGSSDEEGEVLAEAEAVILAAGLACADSHAGPAAQPVRGQASWAALADPSAGRGVRRLCDPDPRRAAVRRHPRPGRRAARCATSDHGRNLAALAQGLPRLAARLADAPLEGRAAIRAATPDRLPVAGRGAGRRGGLFVLSGFGARGFTLAPLLAEHVAALALGAPSPLPTRWRTSSTRPASPGGRRGAFPGPIEDPSRPHHDPSS